MTLEQMPSFAETGTFPERQTAALQLLRACEVYKFLGEKLTDVPESADVSQFVATVNETRAGVRHVIFARFTSLLDQGEGAAGKLILNNTLGEPRTRPSRTSLSHQPRTPRDAA